MIVYNVRKKIIAQSCKKLVRDGPSEKTNVPILRKLSEGWMD